MEYIPWIEISIVVSVFTRKSIGIIVGNDWLLYSTAGITLPDSIWQRPRTLQNKGEGLPIPMPGRKSAAELAASRGKAEDRPSLFSGTHQPPLKSDCSAVIFGHRYAWTHTTP
jgi:hypothetical protein